MQTLISIYPNIKTVKGNETIPIDILLNNIREGKWQDYVLPIRAMRSKDDIKRAKQSVPYVTISGVFSERKNSGLRNHSGLMAIDIDGLNEQLEGIKTLIGHDPYTYAAFTSISGRGLCVLVKIDGERHQDAFDGIASYYLAKYQLNIDTNCSDVSRPRYVSFDPYLLHHEKAVPFKQYLPKQHKRKPVAFVYVPEEFTDLVGRMVSAAVKCTDDYRDWIRIGFGIAETLGEGGREQFHRLSAISGKYEANVVDKQFDICLAGKGKNRSTLSTVYWYAKQAGLDIASQVTRKVAAATSSLKKAGLSADGIVDSLLKFEGIPAEQSRSVVEQAYGSNSDFNEGQSLVENVRMWIRNTYDIKRNLLTRKLEVGGHVLEEIDLNTMFLDAKIIFDKLDFGIFRQVLLSRNTPDYNPVHELIESIEWDGEQRLDRLGMAINSTTGTPEWRSMMVRRWYIGIVSAAYGFTNELNFVLVGGKNTGKTEFFRQLLPAELANYFGTSQLIRGKDDEILMCEKLLILNDEYGGKNKMDERNEKRLMGSHFFDLRMPYGKGNETIRRLATLCGTCNDLDVLDDPTGNRRIIVIESAGKFDYHLYNSLDKYQLLAEGLAAYRAGERPKLTDENIATLESVTEGQYSKVSFESEMILQHFIGPNATNPWDFMTTTQVKNHLENHTRDKININKLGAQLRKLGYTRSKQNGVYGYDIAPIIKPGSIL